MVDKIKDEIILEVVGVDRKTEHLSGYDKPSTTYNKITLESNGQRHNAMRSASVVIPGDVPIGTRFKLTIEQIDEVTPATIIRGAIPNVVEAHVGEYADQLPAAPAEPAPAPVTPPASNPEDDEDIPF